MPVKDDLESQVPVPVLESLTPTDYLLYKLDRTLAIVGIVTITVSSLFVLGEAKEVAIAGISGLVGYIGGRAGK